MIERGFPGDRVTRVMSADRRDGMDRHAAQEHAAQEHAGATPAVAMSADAIRWLRPVRGGTGDLSLICFPHAGAGAAVYRPWQARFVPHVRIVPVQLPGRQDRISEPMFENVEPLL